MDPWYKVATPRKKVREGRSFNPDEFAIAWNRSSRETAGRLSRPGKVLLAHAQRARRDGSRRLSGKTEGTAPVLTLITQFGGRSYTAGSDQGNCLICRRKVA
jgi:hypothetical protein